MKRHERGLVKGGGVGRKDGVKDDRRGGGGNWWLERMEADCECDEGERGMSGDGSGGAEGEETFESDGGVEREIGTGEKSENKKGEWVKLAWLL